MTVDLNNAQVFEKGAYFHPGKFTVKVKVFKAKQARKGSNLVFIEHEVLASNNTEDPVGSTRSHCINLTNDSGPGELKGTLIAFEGMEPTNPAVKQVDWNKKYAQALEVQLYAGLVIDLETFHKPTKSGGVFTTHVYSKAAPKAASSLAEVTIPDLDDAPPLTAAPSLNPLDTAFADGWKVHPKSDKHLFKGTTVKLRDEVLSSYA